MQSLFIAAGLAKAPLAPILAVFLVGRFISYMLFAGAASVAARSLGDLIGPDTGILALASQILGFVALFVVMRFDWKGIFDRWRTNRDQHDGVTLRPS
jgi:hypothetical protein